MVLRLTLHLCVYKKDVAVESCHVISMRSLLFIFCSTVTNKNGTFRLNELLIV